MAMYELQACRVGTLPVPGWECFFGENDTQLHPLAFYVWIVKSADAYGLIDTGLPLDKADQIQLIEGCQKVDRQSVFSEIVTLDELFLARRLAPEQIDFVLLTQIITYHSGGLLPQFFPRAQVYLPLAGIMELLLERPGHPPRDLYFSKATWSFIRDLLIEGRLHLVKGTVEVAPDLRFEATGGHHPGSAAVQAKTSCGTVGILETAFLKKNIDESKPIGIAENAAVCRNVIKRYNKECDFVLADHDPTITERFPDGIIRCK